MVTARLRGRTEPECAHESVGGDPEADNLVEAYKNRRDELWGVQVLNYTSLFLSPTASSLSPRPQVRFFLAAR